MERRTLLLSLPALALLPRPAAAAPIPLADLSRYLNSLSTAEAEFTQINADGTISTGRIFIRRPGRVRFEYAPPDATLVMAGGGQVAIFDAKSNQPPEQYPLTRTPLNLILAANVDLSRARMVTGHREVEGTTRVRAQDPQHPEYGSIEMVFSHRPVALRQWIIRSEDGSETTVILGEMTTGGNFPASYFNITNEARRRGF
ncbi:MAG TPA: outer membrane lipoprotein carrier protein LolA [Paracoccaceae bacterium]|nr:outer membrane lipoprotein carrier protein LolA [Paracoccaceae bacterium]HMO70950.1 outer membrane lipoprotein carrier protein LolA [Paracoccaceae bacterium]